MYDNNLVNQDLAFDLRQGYAHIADTHLKAVAAARFKKNFPEYFENLGYLYTIVHHKFKKTKDAEDKYKELTKKFIELSNKHKETFLGRNREPISYGELMESLMEIERFLYNEMDEANMFGSNRKVQGL